jgi:hypothetical protein
MSQPLDTFVEWFNELTPSEKAEIAVSTASIKSNRAPRSFPNLL